MGKIKEVIGYADSTGEKHVTMDEALKAEVYIAIYHELETLETQVVHPFTKVGIDYVREYIISNKKALLNILCIDSNDIELEPLRK